MPIDFSCSNCGKKLRVPDDSAGKKAKCPQCEQAVDIPSGVPPVAGGMPDFGLPPTGGVQMPADPNPFASPNAGTMKPPAPAAATDGTIHNVVVDFGDIMNYSVEIWKANWGPLALGMLIAIGIPFACIIPFVILAAVAKVEAIIFLGQLAMMAAMIFFGVGYAEMMLKITRGQQADVGSLFKMPERLLPVIGVGILFSLMISLGMMACIVPGFILLFMFWPAQMVVLDGKADVIESFSVARTISANNGLTFFLVWIVGNVIAQLGYIACGIGIFASAPLAGIMWMTAYLMMSGQLPTKQ